MHPALKKSTKTSCVKEETHHSFTAYVGHFRDKPISSLAKSTDMTHVAWYETILLHGQKYVFNKSPWAQ